LTPAVIKMAPGEKQFWRVANASADTILDLQVIYDGKPQQISLVALDGVPVGSQDGTARGKLISVTDLRLPPASRMETPVRTATMIPGEFWPILSRWTTPSALTLKSTPRHLCRRITPSQYISLS
jgi:hypothetical protein